MQRQLEICSAASWYLLFLYFLFLFTWKHNESTHRPVFQQHQQQQQFELQIVGGMCSIVFCTIRHPMRLSVRRMQTFPSESWMENTYTECHAYIIGVDLFWRVACPRRSRRVQCCQPLSLHHCASACFFDRCHRCV